MFFSSLLYQAVTGIGANTLTNFSPVIVAYLKKTSDSNEYYSYGSGTDMLITVDTSRSYYKVGKAYAINFEGIYMSVTSMNRMCHIHLSG